MNLVDSFLGALCLLFLIVLLGDLTEERAASLGLNAEAKNMEDFADAAAAYARDHAEDITQTSGPAGGAALLKEAGHLRPSFPETLNDGRILRLALRKLGPDAAPLLLVTAEGVPDAWQSGSQSRSRFYAQYVLPLVKKLPGGCSVPMESSQAGGRSTDTLYGARSSFALNLKALSLSVPPGSAALLRLISFTTGGTALSDSSVFLHGAEDGLNSMQSDLGFHACAIKDAGAVRFGDPAWHGDTVSSFSDFEHLCAAGDTESGSPEGLTLVLPDAGLSVCRQGHAARLGRSGAFIHSAGLFFAGPEDGVVTNLRTPLWTFSRSVRKPSCPAGTQAAIFAVPAPGFREKNVRTADAGDAWLVSVQSSLLQGTEEADAHAAGDGYALSEEIAEPVSQGRLDLGPGTAVREGAEQDAYYYMADSSVLVMTGCFPLP